MDQNNDIWELIKNDLIRIYKNKDGNLKRFSIEEQTLQIAFSALYEKLKEQYVFQEVFKRGGAGLIVLLKHKILGKRALKIPRPIDKDLIETVENEREMLINLKHKNIMPIYDLGDLELKEHTEYKTYPYFIMKYVKDAVTFNGRIKKLVEQKDTVSENERLNNIMEDVVKIISSIGKAVNFLHENQVIHYDIKPDNILIEKNGNPILTDLGYAKKVTKDGKRTVIGYTYPYAHPSLLLFAHEPSSPDRTKIELIPEVEHKIFDIYAFGKSILEVLKIINDKFPNLVGYNYLFVYMHLAACRMLDGHNYSKHAINNLETKLKELKKPYDFYKEEWLGLSAIDLKDISYKDFNEIVIDFKKITKHTQYILSIPELNYYYPGRVKSSYIYPAPFSERVKLIIEHPVYARLINVPQLAFLNNIYPTASHTRFEHSIGTYRNCCLYIQSLYNDSFNPLFKQLINEYDLNSLLLAALLHDLGHYPLAHIVEESIERYPLKKELETDVKKCYHENFRSYLLNSDIIDNSDPPLTLKKIIEEKWNVKIQDIEDILRINRKTNQNIKLQMMYSIINGPIDVDKLDYLQRDSHNCYLKYGDLIDEDRLIRYLSVIIKDDAKKRRKSLTIGVYEKGRSVAESFIFARYLLYESLYWHHTARSIKAMLSEALIPAIISKPREKKLEPREKKLEGQLIIFSFNDFFNQLDFLKTTKKNISMKKILELLNDSTDENGRMIIKQLKSTVKSKAKQGEITLDEFETFFKELYELTKKKVNLNTEDVLDLILVRTDDFGKELIEMIRQRNYFKRILTIHPGNPLDKEQQGYYDDFKNKVKNYKSEFQSKIAERIKIKFNDLLAKAKGTTDTETLSDENVKKVIDTLSKRHSIICDIPEAKLGTEDVLRLIPEPHRFRQNYDTRGEIGSRISDLYHQLYSNLMEKTSKGRIFCHPDIRDALLNVLTPELIRECVEEAIKQL